MSFVVEVRKDDEMQFLAFADEEGANQFITLGRLYQIETGVGNGYGAYWVCNPNAKAVPEAEPGLTKELDIPRVQSMVNDIVRERLAGETSSCAPDITFGRKEGLIFFRLGELPPHLVPTTGDMFRIVDYTQVPEGMDYYEGRVLRVEGDQAEIVGYGNIEGVDKVREGAPTSMVPLKALMKIPDWLRRCREK